MNINVGDYVRTKYGIAKVEEDRRINYGLIHPVIDILKPEVIIKSRPNIIDLIEEGDYVNGEKILEITEREKTPDMKKYFLTSRSIDYGVRLSEDELNSVIETIITKEQIEAMEYKIER